MLPLALPLGHVLQEVSKTCPHLLRAGQNLVRRQDESVCTGITELDGHRVLCLSVLERVIYAVATNLVDGVADRTASESRAMDSLDSSNCALSEAGVGRRVGQSARASVAVGVHPQLRVGVNIHVELNTLACSKAIELSLQCLRLDTVTSRRTLVVFVTGRRAGALSLAPGLVRPVPVDVATDAARRGGGLPVLSPKTVAVLGEVEPVWVDNWEDVEVVLVLEGGGCGISGCQELVCGVLVDHGGNPLSCVHGAVPDYSLLRALASATPDVDALDVASLKRLACGDDLGVRRVRSGEVGDPLVVVGKSVV